MGKTNNIKNYYNNIFVVLLVGLIFVMTFRFTIREGMHKSTKNAVYMNECISGAITSMEFGRSGYVIYKKLFDKWVSNPVNDDITIKNLLDTEDAHSEGIIVTGGDNGGIDYTRAAFLLFGYSVSSLLYLYFLLFSISILILYIKYRKNQLTIVILLLFMLSHYGVVLVASRHTHDLGVIYNPRFITVLSILPLFHICLSCITIKENKLYDYVADFFQALIIVFIFHVRSSLLWILILVFVAIGSNLIKIIYYKYYNSRLSAVHKPNAIVFFIQRTIKDIKPIYILLFVFIIFNIIWKNSLDKSMFNKVPNRHEHWMTIYDGLAIHHKIRESYSDERTQTGYVHRLGENGQPGASARIFHDTEDAHRAINEFCNENFINNHKLQGETAKYYLRKFICSNKIRRLYEKINVLRFRYLYYSDDQDGYSAVFKWLYEHSNDGDRGVFDVVQYGTDYYNDFTWFKTHNKLYENNFYVNNHDTLNVRKFDWMTDYDRTKANDVLRKVIKSVIMTHPLQVIELTLFIKPFQFLHIYLNHYIINYIVYLTLFPSIVAISILLYSTIIVKKLSSNELNSLYGLVLIIFLFSSITMFFTYPAFKMVDQALLFSMCINCVIIGTLSKYSGKVKKILVHISRKFLRISFLENIKKNMRIFHSS